VSLASITRTCLNIGAAVMRSARCSRCAANFPIRPLCSPPSAAGRSPRTLWVATSSASAGEPDCPPSTLTCSGTPAATPWRMPATTRGNPVLARPSLNPAHCPLHRADANPVQRLPEIRGDLKFDVKTSGS
jgi:hypothetical protein